MAEALAPLLTARSARLVEVPALAPSGAVRAAEVARSTGVGSTALEAAFLASATMAREALPRGRSLGTGPLMTGPVVGAYGDLRHVRGNRRRHRQAVVTARTGAQEALALLDDVALAHQLPEGALELGLLARVQARESQELLDAQRVVGFGEDLLEKV